MKDMLRRGQARGMKFECDDCHRNETDFSELSPGAREQFSNLLSAIK